MGGADFQSPKGMATKFASREDLVLATVRVGLIARIERVLMELSMLITERPGLAGKAWKTSEPLWEKPFQVQDLCSFTTRRNSWVCEDELQEEDHLGKKSFVLKAILHVLLE